MAISDATPLRVSAEQVVVTLYAEAVAYVKQQYRTLTGEDLTIPAQDELPL
jgi:hypothetical protein